MVVSSSGYYATGSSAINDLLREYTCNTIGIVGEREYEHILFYTPGGLFDLEDKLLKGNSIHRSDEAIKCFLSEMDRLYQYDFGWFGGYEKLIGDSFVNINKRFIDKLIQFRVAAHWSYHIRKVGFSFKKIRYSIKNILQGKKIRGKFWEGYHYGNNREILYSFPSYEEFYQSAKEYVIDYFKCICGHETEKNLVLNHAILPQHIGRIMEYGIDDFYVITVDRDPRDVYAYIKFVGKQRGVKSRIPTDVYEFIKFWRAMRSHKTEDSARVLNIKFEDLIYKYEDTVTLIENFLGIESNNHEKKKCYFDPKVSIENTQIYKRFEVYKDEIDIIEKELKEYIYDFPDREFRENIAIEDLGNVHMKGRRT